MNLGIYRGDGNHFSDIKMKGGEAYYPSDYDLGAPPASSGPIARAATSVPRPSMHAQSIAKPQTSRVSIGGIDASYDSREAATLDIGAPHVPALPVQSPIESKRAYAGDFVQDGEQSRNEARARQQLALAAGTSIENGIARRNSLENAARNAAQDSRSLRLVPGGRTQRMLKERSLDLATLAADDEPLDLDIGLIRTPEQEAALSQLPLQNRLMQQEMDSRSLVARAEAAKALRGPLETFGNPVDEVDSAGKPIRAQYGDQGSRRIIDGAQPLPKGKGGGLTIGPNGEVMFSDAGSPKLTEQQSKDLNYYTRGAEALKNLGDGSVLANPIAKAGGSVPLVGNALTGSDYQQADQAGREFLASVLRKDTGAAITAKEMELYGKTYLPQPFDSPAVLQQKAQARQTALEAIKSGMGPAQQLVPDGSSSTSDKSYSHLWE